MRLSSKRAAAIVVLCSGSLIAASCGGSDDDSSGQTSYVLEDLPEDQFLPAESESSVADETLLSEMPSQSTTSVGSSELEVPSEPDFRMPLTGRPLVSVGDIPDRPALAVKMPNNRKAMPQTGLNEADIVFEQIINDGVTRFVAVFHSQGSCLLYTSPSPRDS